MPITEILEENARKYGPEVALVDINPQGILPPCLLAGVFPD